MCSQWRAKAGEESERGGFSSNKSCMKERKRRRKIFESIFHAIEFEAEQRWLDSPHFAFNQIYGAIKCQDCAYYKMLFMWLPWYTNTLNTYKYLCNINCIDGKSLGWLKYTFNGFPFSQLPFFLFFLWFGFIVAPENAKNCISESYVSLHLFTAQLCIQTKVSDTF